MYAPSPTARPPDVGRLASDSLLCTACCSSPVEVTLGLSSERSSEHFLTPSTLEIPSKPHTSLDVFCSRPYAEHSVQNGRKQPLISAAPTLLYSSQKQPLRWAGPLPDRRWEVPYESHRTRGAVFRQRHFPFCGGFYFKREAEAHIDTLISYFRFSNYFLICCVSPVTASVFADKRLERIPVSDLLGSSPRCLSGFGGVFP